MPSKLQQAASGTGDHRGTAHAKVPLDTTSPAIDPDAAGLGGLAPLLSLDMLGIYEDRIYVLYKYVCGMDITKMIAVIRANQLGIAGVTESALNHAIDSRGDGLDVDAVLAAVMDDLPNFAPKVDEEAQKMIK